VLVQLGEREISVYTAVPDDVNLGSRTPPMILPQSYFASLLLVVMGILCWGSWANTLKFAGKWRFELYCFDFAAGVLIAAVIYALTLGSMGFDGFLFQDDLLQAGKHSLLFGVLGGVIFNLGNMMLAGAISVAGLAAAFPVATGLALVTGVLSGYAFAGRGSVPLMIAGAAVVLLAVAANLAAYRKQARIKLEEQAKAGLLKTSVPRVPISGIMLACFGGILMGGLLPFVQYARTYGTGVGPYTLTFCAGAGVFFSTLPFNLFFMNLPVEGDPLEIREYFTAGTLHSHAMGLLGGVIWVTGTLALFVAAQAEDAARIGSFPGIYALGGTAALVGSLWGILAWKEFHGADLRVKSLLVSLFALFLCGLALIVTAVLNPR
jgi:glucose uptake protein